MKNDANASKDTRVKDLRYMHRFASFVRQRGSDHAVSVMERRRVMMSGGGGGEGVPKPHPNPTTATTG